MATHPYNNQIKEELQRMVKDEVEFWQKKALAASEDNDQVKLRHALDRQGQAIATLLRFIESR